MWQIPCKMTNSSSKPLQTLGKWYQPRNPKKIPKPAEKKNPKTISHPLLGGAKMCVCVCGCEIHNMVLERFKKGQNCHAGCHALWLLKQYGPVPPVVGDNRMIIRHAASRISPNTTGWKRASEGILGPMCLKTQRREQSCLIHVDSFYLSLFIIT